MSSREALSSGPTWPVMLVDVAGRRASNEGGQSLGFFTLEHSKACGCGGSRFMRAEVYEDEPCEPYV